MISPSHEQGVGLFLQDVYFPLNIPNFLGEEGIENELGLYPQDLIKVFCY